MRGLNAVFDKMWVRAFYIAHFLPFLFLFLMLFGLVPFDILLSFHKSLLETAFSSVPILGVFILILLLYVLNSYRFIYHVLHEANSRFIFVSGTTPTYTLLASLSRSLTLVNMPVLVYSFLGIGVGITHKRWVEILLVLAFWLLAFILQLLFLRYILTNPNRMIGLISNKKLFNITFRPTLFSICLRYMLRECKFLIAGVKIGSCLFLYAAHYEWKIFNFDIRWMQIALAPGLALQGLLIFEIWDFETVSLAFSRSFPTPLWKRYLQILAISTLLLLPEFILLTSYSYTYHILYQIPVYLLFILSFPMFCYAILYTNEFDKEGYNSLLGALVIICFFVSLCYGGAILATTLSAASFIIFVQSYYKFERKSSF